MGHMGIRFAPAYLEALFSPGKYENLVEIASLLQASSSFSAQKDDYGLGIYLFALVESLTWFAQSLRSGAWTYFESTPIPRQDRMCSSLAVLAPPGFAEQYKLGATRWRDQVAMRDLDRWMEKHDDENNLWLWRLAQEQRASVLRYVS